MSRLSLVRCDLMLDTHLRLTEHERALILSMLRRLSSDIANEILAKLPENSSNHEDSEGLTEDLLRAGLLDDPQLLATLVRRAEEERASSISLARNRGSAASLLQNLIADADAPVAAAAMAAVVARARRRDQFGGPVVELNDLKPRAATELVYNVAAGLAASAAESISLPHFHDAARAVLTMHEPERGLASVLEQLTRSLNERERTGEEFLLAIIDAADLSLLASVLASKAGLTFDDAYDDLLSRETIRTMTLLRMANAPRAVAAHLLGSVGDLIGVPPDSSSLAVFDQISEADVEAARTWRQFDDCYRSALISLGLSGADKLA